MVHALTAGRQSYSREQRCAAPFDFIGNARADGDGWDVSICGDGSKHLEKSCIEQLLEIIEQELCVQNVRPEQSFKELGADSLDFINIIMEARKFGPISNEQAIAIRTVADLMAVFE